MDFSKLTNNNKMAIGSGAFALVSGLFPWFNIGGFGDFGDVFDIKTSASGYDTGALVTLGLLLIAGGVAVLFMKVMDIKDITVQKLAAEQIAMLVVALGVAFVLLRFVSAPAGVDRAWGMFVGILASCAALAGTFLSAKDVGITIPSADDFKAVESSEAPTTF